MLRHKKLLLIAAPLVLSLTAIGCGGSKGGILATVQPQTSGQSNAGGASGNNASGANNAQPTKAPSSSSSGGGNVSSSEIAQLYANFAKVKSFRLTADVGGGQKFEMEVVQPDKFHYVVSGGATGNIEIITIGNDTYVKTGSTWIKQPGAGTGNIFNVKSLSDQVQKASANDKSFTKGGTDTVNGKKCQIYTDNTDGGEICVADGLPLKVVTKGGSDNATLIFSDYNANINIKAPI